MPLLKGYGFDAIWSGTLFSGGRHGRRHSVSPFGYTLFALKSAAPGCGDERRSISAAWPFVWIIVLGMVVMALFPPLITFLPNLANPVRAIPPKRPSSTSTSQTGGAVPGIERRRLSAGETPPRRPTRARASHW